MHMLDAKLQIRFVSAEPERILNQLLAAGVILHDIRYGDSLTTDVFIAKKQYVLLSQVMKRTKTENRIVKEAGVQSRLRKFRHRPILIIGVLLYLFTILYIPGRIYFIEVTGNEHLTDRQIVAAAEKAGLYFGCSAKELRSEEKKNEMLAALPQLQWIGINTNGCVATIRVRERSSSEFLTETQVGIRHIVASRDGLVTDITVEQGTSIVSLGQSVTEGELLVSGYRDCGLKIVAQKASAEIMAHTIHTVTFISPVESGKIERLIKEHICYQLQIGKKVINFCNHSGIPGALCVKMYSEDCWTLPGGFRLPVSLNQINCRYYEILSAQMDGEIVKQWMPDAARKYLKEQMVSGQILREDLKWSVNTDSFQFTGVYGCHEMIGKVKYEEITEHNAEDN